MHIEDWFMVLAAVILCVAACYLPVREKGNIPKSRMIYSGIMILTVAGITLMLQLFYVNNSLIHNIKRVCLLSLLGPIAYTDFTETRIPNIYIILGLIYRGILIPVELLFSREIFLSTILSEVVAASALFLAALLCRICIKNSIGAGDMKLFLVMGLFLGLNGIWSAILLSLIVSFIIAVFLLISKRKTKKDSMAFGPALTIGTFLSIFLTGM